MMEMDAARDEAEREALLQQGLARLKHTVDCLETARSTHTERQQRRRRKQKTSVKHEQGTDDTLAASSPRQAATSSGIIGEAQSDIRYRCQAQTEKAFDCVQGKRENMNGFTFDPQHRQEGDYQ